MIIKMHRSIPRKKRFKQIIRQGMRMRMFRWKDHEIRYVHYPNSEWGYVKTEEWGGGYDFEGYFDAYAYQNAKMFKFQISNFDGRIE